MLEEMHMTFVTADSPKVSSWPVVFTSVHVHVMVVPDGMRRGGEYSWGGGDDQEVVVYSVTPVDVVATKFVAYLCMWLSAVRM
jgi:hypothetical protein